jgi:hypothetical protein
MSDTPETDAETMQDEWDHVDTDIGPFAPSTMVSADFARGLERERDEARAELRLRPDALSHDAWDNICRRLERERDEAREAIIATLEQNRRLADGDDCTLAKLKSVVPEWK